MHDNSFFRYFGGINQAIGRLDYGAVERAYLVASSCRNLYIFGNGGSAAIANHWVCDYAKGINEDTRRGASAVSLSSNVPLITAIANDIGYEYVFSKQLEYLRPDPSDAVFAVSSSGNSRNVVRGIEKARQLGLTTVALTGFTGGEASRAADISVHVPTDNYGVVEDVHMMVLHAISQRIRYEGARDPESLRL